MRQKNINFPQRQAAADRNYKRRRVQQAAQKGQTSHPPNPGAPRRAVPQARPQLWSSDSLYLIPLLRGVAKAALYRAHRTSTVSPCAFCEQEGHLAVPRPLFGILLGFCCEMGADPIADRCGHLVKILPPSELVIGSWQEI
jgi:hypothetical protein